MWLDQIHPFWETHHVCAALGGDACLHACRSSQQLAWPSFRNFRNSCSNDFCLPPMHIIQVSSLPHHHRRRFDCQQQYFLQAKPRHRFGYDTSHRHTPCIPGKGIKAKPTGAVTQKHGNVMLKQSALQESAFRPAHCRPWSLCTEPPCSTTAQRPLGAQPSLRSDFPLPQFPAYNKLGFRRLMKI